MSTEGEWLLTEASLYDKMLAALNFACEAHMFQTRKALEVDPKDGKLKPTSYIVHPVRVARSISELVDWHEREEADDREAITVAALFHDMLEDTHVTHKVLLDEFGADIADIVLECTFGPGEQKLSKSQIKQEQIERSKKMSHAACIVKMGDLLDNLRDFGRVVPPGWTVQRVQGYFVWKYKVMLEYVTREIKGTKRLVAAINRVFAENSFKLDGQWHDCLPRFAKHELFSEEEYDEILKAFYLLIDE